MKPPLALLALLLVALPGCLATRSGRPEHTSSRHIQPRGPQDQARPVRWRRILMGAGSRQAHVGYLRSDAVSPGLDPQLVHSVYDLNMERVGRMSPSGRTYRQDEFEREQELGLFSLEQGLLSIWGRTEDDLVTLVPMPPPE